MALFKDLDEQSTETQEALDDVNQVVTDAADDTLLARVTSEATARVAADTAINNRINGVEGRVGNLEGRVGILENKVDSSTAVAIAMGGATFLPDMDFNLAANVGRAGNFCRLWCARIQERGVLGCDRPRHEQGR